MHWANNWYFNLFINLGYKQSLSINHGTSKVHGKRQFTSESSQEERESELAPKISQTLKSFHAIKDEYKSLVNEVWEWKVESPLFPGFLNINLQFFQIEELKTAQTAAMTEILGQLESATGDMDKLKHILGEDAAKTEKPE